MSAFTVVVTNTTCARFFALEDASVPEMESSPKLIEQYCILNPREEKSESKRLGSSTSGRNRASSGGSYAFDDHRAKHETETLRRFAKQVVTDAVKLTRRQDAGHSLVLAAEKRILGLIRDELRSKKTNGLIIKEAVGDLAGESPMKIQELLARRSLIPKMQKPARRVRKT
jgi:protein required for attachment to host cells